MYVQVRLKVSFPRLGCPEPTTEMTECLALEFHNELLVEDSAVLFIFI